ncbi:MAG: hypothetical protein Q8K79_07410 [Solirubrobacteraceae bacterium]|nr:hypothetical protein [Solirubrobacteraceae bacterium]
MLGGLAGCADGSGAADGGTTAAPKPPARPALCRPDLRSRVTGRVQAAGATELSGLVFSTTRRDVLWSLNDSGNPPALFAFTTGGRPVAEVAVAGAVNTDWEDLAAGRRGTLLVGDIGDNLAERPSVTVLKVPEPRPGAVSVAPTARYELRYSDGPRDAEALLFDRSDGSLVVVSKSFGPAGGIYVARRPSSRRPSTLRRTGTVRLDEGQAVTAGDVSADGRTIVLRTYDLAYAWRRRAGETVAAALRRRPCMTDAGLLSEGQGETIALTADGRAFLTVPEGPHPAVRRYGSSGEAP